MAPFFFRVEFIYYYAKEVKTMIILMILAAFFGIKTDKKGHELLVEEREVLKSQNYRSYFG